MKIARPIIVIIFSVFTLKRLPRIFSTNNNANCPPSIGTIGMRFAIPSANDMEANSDN